MTKLPVSEQGIKIKIEEKFLPRPGIIQNATFSGFEPGTFRSSVWRSPNWAISATMNAFWITTAYYNKLEGCLKNTYTIYLGKDQSKFEIVKICKYYHKVAKNSEVW